MMQFRVEEKTRLRRQKTEQAISLAMQNRWEEAAAVNKSIVEIFPTDVDAYNRLGKALAELGRNTKAREAYKRALDLSPSNHIAKKNLDRLSSLSDSTEQSASRQVPDGLVPDLFLEEAGKTGICELIHLAPSEVRAKLTGGDVVNLKPSGKLLMVETGSGEYLGQVEPKLGLRLIKFMEKGNRYAAATASVENNTVRIIIKETYQHPDMVGRISFPPREAERFRPYTKDTLIRYEIDEDEGFEEEEEEPGKWAEPAESQDEVHIISDDEVVAQEAMEDDESEV
ncbi:MAG: tetratricopeptide repeat protein [Chloroflexi bacterium]|nr:tetratricopeptide repeat protein [Chloroflexota bacterium]